MQYIDIVQNLTIHVIVNVVKFQRIKNKSFNWDMYELRIKFFAVIQALVGKNIIFIGKFRELKLMLNRKCRMNQWNNFWRVMQHQSWKTFKIMNKIRSYPQKFRHLEGVSRYVIDKLALMLVKCANYMTLLQNMICHTDYFTWFD